MGKEGKGGINYVVVWEKKGIGRWVRGVNREWGWAESECGLGIGEGERERGKGEGGHMEREEVVSYVTCPH